MNSFIQLTLFPDLDCQQIIPIPRAKRLPVETALDLFPRIEKQLVFADYFPGFETGQKQFL